MRGQASETVPLRGMVAPGSLQVKRAGVISLKIIGVVFVVMIVVSYLIPVAKSADNTVSLVITVPAVEEPSGRGVLINVKIEIGPGGGEIDVSSEGKVGDLTEASIQQAVITATILAGYDWKNYNYKIKFINASNVNGPSASAAIATAVYLLISSSPLAEKFANTTVMTGAITPIGLYSAIGGVPEKCSAAAQAGKLFVYPLANFMGTIPGCKGSYMSAPGILGAVEIIGNYTTAIKPPQISMPYIFKESMRNASLYMSNATLQVLRTVRNMGVNLNSSTQYLEAVKALDESNRTRDSLPYVSASKAFYALYNAFILYYLALTQNLPSDSLSSYITSEAKKLEDNLTTLEEQLSSMPQNGSAYYVEFLGTAYARIASAQSELNKASFFAKTSPLDALATLAYARARIYSVYSWISSARDTRGLTPYFNTTDVMSLTSTLGDYAHIAVSYSLSLASYMIKNYKNKVDKEFLQKSIQSLSEVISKGDYYSTRGNYIAAMGFYREALSESMNTIFSVIITNNTNKTAIYRGYLTETKKLYTYLSTQLSWRGIIPGLAPAYMEYAQYEENKGDLETALSLARSALASTLAWYLYYIVKSQNGPMGWNQGFPRGRGLGGGAGLVGLIVAVIAGLAIGLIIVGSLYRRALEKVVVPAQLEIVEEGAPPPVLPA